MKAEILSLLRERDGYVSGQEICERFGVTRAAVWKVIDRLRREGYRIEAAPNRGYRLAEGSCFGRDELVSRIHTGWAGRSLAFYDCVASTNGVAKAAGEAGAPHGFVAVADSQSAGRGRRGREWVSPKGVNLYFTILLRPEILPQKASMLTLVMAHAVAAALERETGKEAGIKWPNDIIMEGRKVCGILTELSLERDYIHYLVIGVGINVGAQEFPEELRDKAVSLEQACGRPADRARLFQYVMEAFEADYESFMRAGDLTSLLESYNARLVNRDACVRVLDPKGQWEGIARGITSTGELAVEREGGEIAYVYAGEVSVRGVCGYV